MAAQRNELNDVKKILEGRGGKESKMIELEMRGALFAGAEQATINTDRRRERDRIVKEQKQAIEEQKGTSAVVNSETAQSEMKKALSALIVRGEKIEGMEQKTRDLEAEGKTFADLAAALKDEVKKKKWYQL